MKRNAGSDFSKILPILTVVGTFAAVGIILFSVLSKREEMRASMPDPTEAVPGVIADETDPPELTDITDVTTSALTEAPTEPDTGSETIPPVQTIPVGIYTKSGKTLTRVDEYEGMFPESDDDDMWTLDTWTYPDRQNLICDLRYFAVVTSYEKEIDFTYWDETWVDRWNVCGLDFSYKIGFEFLIRKKDGEEVRFTVLSPSDTFKEEEYFELYLYDCVAHAHDSRYSHITEKTNYDDTENVMIKITLRRGCYDIDEIVMTAFVYGSADEFDSSGFYTGANRASCVIRRGEE